MPVNTTHPDFDKNKDRWSLVRSVINNDAKQFIREVDPEDDFRCMQYREGAILTNFTSLTRDGLSGLVFRNPPSLKIPSSLTYVQDDATGDGRNLNQLSKQVLDEVMTTGRVGVLIDYPRVESGLSMRDTVDLAARLIMYRSENIINWSVKRQNGTSHIDFVVLYEPRLELQEDGFDWDMEEYYRVLRLDQEGYYFQAIYGPDLELEATMYPTDKDGNKLREIPFVFIGSEDNNEDVDKAPLYDIASLNIGHYRNSADYEESVFVVGQPTVFVSGSWGLEEFKEALPQGIKFGSRAGYFLGENGNAKLVQASPNQLAEVAMKQKMQQAAQIGARLISEPGGRETAEAARMRYSSQNSVLHTVVMNVNHGIDNCLRLATIFMGGNIDEIEFILNTKFYEETADPNVIAQTILLYDRGLMSKQEVREDLKQKNLVDRNKTDEEYQAEVEDVSPFGPDTAEE